MLERDFALELSSALKSEGFYSTRLESRYTETGIPDMYVMGLDTFLELKVVNKTLQECLKSTYYRPDWRPGQLAWSRRYTLANKKAMYTVVGCTDGVLLLPSTRAEPLGVPKEDIIVLKNCTEAVQLLKVVCAR